MNNIYDERAQAQDLAMALGMTYVDMTRRPQIEAIKAVPYAVAQQHMVVPLALGVTGIMVAVASEPTEAMLADLRACTGREKVECLIAARSDIQRAISIAYLSPVTALEAAERAALKAWHEYFQANIDAVLTEKRLRSEVLAIKELLRWREEQDVQVLRIEERLDQILGGIAEQVHTSRVRIEVIPMQDADLDADNRIILDACYDVSDVMPGKALRVTLAPMSQG